MSPTKCPSRKPLIEKVPGRYRRLGCLEKSSYQDRQSPQLLMRLPPAWIPHRDDMLALRLCHLHIPATGQVMCTPSVGKAVVLKGFLDNGAIGDHHHIASLMIQRHCYCRGPPNQHSASIIARANWCCATILLSRIDTVHERALPNE